MTIKICQYIGRSDELAKRRGIEELYRWSSSLSLLAQIPGPVMRQMLHLLGPRPYVFECNPQRWPDGLAHLVDRSYREIGRVALTADQANKTGLRAWNESKWCRVAMSNGTYAITDDIFMLDATKIAAKQLAKVLLDVAAELSQPVCDGRD